MKKRIFTLTVNYDDPRWHEIRSADYSLVEGSLTVDRFPLQGKGQQQVTMELVCNKEVATTQEIIDEIKRRGYRLPDRAETEAFLEANPEESKTPIFSLCGSILRKGRRSTIPCLFHWRKRRMLNLMPLTSLWGQGNCFPAVRLPKKSKMKKAK